MVRLSLFIFLAFLSVNSAALADDGIENCNYNEMTGTVVGRFSAHEPKASRGWVPLDLVLCKNEQRVFAIISSQAVALGVLWNLPLKTPEYKGVKAEEDKVILQWSNHEDDREALKALEDKKVQAVILGGTSATQLTVFRKELENVYSNTLFGSFVEDKTQK